MGGTVCHGGYGSGAVSAPFFIYRRYLSSWSNLTTHVSCRDDRVSSKISQHGQTQSFANWVYSLTMFGWMQALSQLHRHSLVFHKVQIVDPIITPINQFSGENLSHLLAPKGDF